MGEMEAYQDQPDLTSTSPSPNLQDTLELRRDQRVVKKAPPPPTYSTMPAILHKLCVSELKPKEETVQ